MRYLLLTAIFATSSAALADTSWCHSRLRSSDQTAISVDYQEEFVPDPFNPTGSNMKLSPLWINVQDGGLTGVEAVRAVVLDFTYAYPHGWMGNANLAKT